MKKNYITPIVTQFAVGSAGHLLSGSSKTDGNRIDSKGFRSGGDPDNAASRGGGGWDDED